MRTCVCLCPFNHPAERGICTGTADTSFRVAIPDDDWRAPYVGAGERTIPACSACTTARASAPRRGRRGRPRVEANRPSTS
jgi:hypothetical protein